MLLSSSVCVHVCASKHFQALLHRFMYVSLTFGCLQFSLPLPQGGRDAITKNLILREDQLPQKFLYPKTKKKVNKQVNLSSIFEFSRKVLDPVVYPSGFVTSWFSVKNSFNTMCLNSDYN